MSSLAAARRILVAVTALSWLAPVLLPARAAAHAVESTIPGQSLSLRQGKTPRSNRFQLRIKNAEEFDLRHDPAEDGMTLLVSGAGSSPDAVTGARLATLGLPTATASRAAVDGSSPYIGYGLGGPGGIRAFILP